MHRGEHTAEIDTRTGDAHYDLISALYHALHTCATNGLYIEDAERANDPEVAQFFREVQNMNGQLADRAKQLLQKRLSA